MTWNPNRSSKTEARKLAMNFAPGKKSMLMMPGLHCLDLKLGHELSLFNRQAQFTLVEQDPETAHSIAGYCGKDHRYKLLVKKLEDVFDELPQQIDFAYIDLCGAVTRKLAKWFPTFFQHTADKADVAITMCLQKRGNKRYINELLEEFKTQQPEEYKAAYEHYVINENLPGWIAKVMCAQLWPVFLAARNAQLKVVKCLFHTYQDSLGSGWMCLYRISTERDKTMNASTLARELVAAKTPGAKSHVTRRINKHVADQVKAGKNGTQVRAGIKSWETRLSGSKPAAKEDTAASLAKAFVDAKSSQAKAAINRKMERLAEDKAKKEGRSKTQILAGWKSWITRYTNA